LRRERTDKKFSSEKSEGNLSGNASP
jgi:hypothetical protein